jgi:hypothetical protein
VKGDHLPLEINHCARQMVGVIVYKQQPFEDKKLKKGKKLPERYRVSGWGKFVYR